MAGFIPKQSYSIAATATSAATVIPEGDYVLLDNWGANEVFVNFGTDLVAATTSSMVVPSGKDKLVKRPAGATHVAAICSATETTTLNVVTGQWQG